jgi:hypothetical protein
MSADTIAQRRPRPSRLRRSTRRWIVVMAVALVALLLGAQAFLVAAGSVGSDLLRLAIVLLTLGVLTLVMTRSIHWFVGNAPDSALDERERALRDRCYFHAYAIYAGLTVMGGFYFVDLAPDLGLWMPTDHDAWWAITWGMLIMALTLPTMFVAWSEPDPQLGD